MAEGKLKDKTIQNHMNLINSRVKKYYPCLVYKAEKGILKYKG